MYLINTIILISYINMNLIFTKIRGFPSSPKRRSRRSLPDFQDMMRCYQPWIEIVGYVDYGCYCGVGGEGIPVDETDKCCYTHDKCYDAFDTSLVTYVVGYEYECHGNRGKCDADANSEYEQNLCECDRAAAECFLRYRNTKSDSLFNIDTDACCSVPLGKDCKVQASPHVLTRLYDCERKIDEDACCKGQGYNSFYRECCNGVLHEKPDPWDKSGRMQCCFREYYDVTEKICCKGRLHVKMSASVECCGPHKVDTKHHYCQNGTVHRKNEIN